VRTLRDDEFEVALRAKLNEEVGEYLATRTREGDDLDELADILEVVYALASLGGASRADLESLRETKAARSGAFLGRVLLIDSSESPQG
jgi:predicted house-cleaning noncanonical NTP pyrophosphatase (MazG superfamily)